MHSVTIPIVGRGGHTLPPYQGQPPPPRPLPPPPSYSPQKYYNFKQCNKGLEISLYTIVPKIMIIYYTVLEIWHVSEVIAIFHFGQFLALLPP